MTNARMSAPGNFSDSRLGEVGTWILIIAGATAGVVLCAVLLCCFCMKCCRRNVTATLFGAWGKHGSRGLASWALHNGVSLRRVSHQKESSQVKIAPRPHVNLPDLESQEVQPKPRPRPTALSASEGFESTATGASHVTAAASGTPPKSPLSPLQEVDRLPGEVQSSMKQHPTDWLQIPDTGNRRPSGVSNDSNMSSMRTAGPSPKKSPRLGAPAPAGRGGMLLSPSGRASMDSASNSQLRETGALYCSPRAGAGSMLCQ